MKFEESETVELKKSSSEMKEAIISIVAILNKHRYGELFFGIKNDGTIVGQMVSERTIRQISNTISDNVEPKIFPISLFQKAVFREVLRALNSLPFCKIE